ncbi:hypothetical protein NUW58_g9570 [Xylaria curta]|uniref:Uncharacterized protein n=1 Tax=Xylaria curta TaxID=42375 RepID=A0ACC1MXF0_9PEZI|nr:hypothetical protein NUW58_g9570 [Xylaria curta]
MGGTWEVLAAKKRQDLLDSIPEAWRIPSHILPPESQDDVTGFPAKSGWFTQEELDITNLTALELLPRLASGKLKSETVTRAFCKRAAAAHQLVRTPNTSRVCELTLIPRSIAFRKHASSEPSKLQRH